MKKGGSADGHKKMAHGGAMGMLASTPAFVGRPAVNAPVRSPGKPSAADRMKAQKSMTTKTVSSPKSGKAPMKQMSKQEVMVNRTEGMKDGGKVDMAQDKAMIKKAFKQHDTQEHKGGKGTNLKLKSGGVSMGNGGGFKNGGNVPAEKDRSPTKTLKTPNKKISTAKTDAGYEQYATGGVAKSNAGGFATGGVAMSNAGGFKNGGASKKHYATGGIVNTGKPVAMPQGNQPIPAPKTQQNFSGTYKTGGKVENTRLRNALDTQNAPDMKNAKLDDNLKYPKTMNSPQKAPKFV